MAEMEVIITALAILAGFFVHTILGFGGAILAVPILASIYTVPEAVSLMLLNYIPYTLYMMYMHGHGSNTKEVRKVGISALFGVLAGSFFISIVQEKSIKIGLGFAIIGYLIYTHKTRISKEWVQKCGIPLGFLSGIGSILFGVGGPPLVAYFSETTSTKKQLRASLINTLAFLHFSTTPVLILTGLVELKFFLYSLSFLPCFFVGIFFGNIVHERIDEKRFKFLVYTFLFLSAINLIVR